MFDELFSIDNFFQAWRKFKLGKGRKKDVVSFEYHLEDNIFSLYQEVTNLSYKHSKYKYFQVFDNKKRDIYKADVRDRVIHQVIYKYLSILYELVFIADSYSSRDYKGHHKAIRTLQYFIKLTSGKNAKKSYILKCDVKKYFNSIDHCILLEILKEKVICPKILNIIKEIISSFSSSGNSRGIPLGNITSQIFANIYLHKLDLYIKKELDFRFYIRYNDDFVIVGDNLQILENARTKIIAFALKELKLPIPFEKTKIYNALQGIDFLGYIVLPKAILLRNKTKGRMFKNICDKNIDSYFGMLKHCNSHTLKQKVLAKVNHDGYF